MFSLFGNNEIDETQTASKDLASLRFASLYFWPFSVINFIIPSKLNINTLLFSFSVTVKCHQDFTSTDFKNNLGSLNMDVL